MALAQHFHVPMWAVRSEGIVSKRCSLAFLNLAGSSYGGFAAASSARAGWPGTSFEKGVALASAGAPPEIASGDAIAAGRSRLWTVSNTGCDPRRVRTTRRISKPSGEQRLSTLPIPQTGAASVASACVGLPARRLMPRSCDSLSGASELTQAEMFFVTRIPGGVAYRENRTHELVLEPQEGPGMSSGPVHTVADIPDAFLHRNPEWKEYPVAHSGRFTEPAVEHAESHCKYVFRHVYQDGHVTADEERLMCSCEEVVYQTRAADATVEIMNAMMHRQGYRSKQFARKLREKGNELLQFRQRMTEPEPSGPVAAKRAA